MPLNVTKGTNQASLPGAFRSSRSRLVILVAEDNEDSFKILDTILTMAGHMTLRAENGRQAIEIFSRQHVELVLMDVMMPEVDGYEATIEIKSLCGDRFVPVIFLTAMTEENALTKCIDVGGDDFVTKPYNAALLLAKINAMSRLIEVHTMITEQRDTLNRQNALIQQEYELAEKVFSGIMKHTGKDSHNIKTRVSPVASVNGDVILEKTANDGRQYLLLGDFTGHGLSAAIGAIPVADLFHSLASKGCDLDELARQINHALYLNLPPNIFMAAALMLYDPNFNKISVLNAGMPPVILVENQSGVIQCFPSKNLPLGVVVDHNFISHKEVTTLLRDCRIYSYSDGLSELRDHNDKLLDSDAILRIIHANRDRDCLFNEICNMIDRFKERSSQHDDITLAEFTCSVNHRQIPDKSGPNLSGTWKMALMLEGRSLAHFDPLFFLNYLISEFPLLWHHRTTLYTIISELYYNALDHGILKLDSSKRDSFDGFEQYYTIRNKALRCIEYGTIHLSVEHRHRNGIQELVIECMDSGEGFNFDELEYTPNLEYKQHGNGLTLVKNLCHRLRYDKNQNSLEVVYRLKGRTAS